MLVYLIVGGSGLLIMLLSFVAGDLLEAIDLLDLGISSLAIGTALALAGAVGVLAQSRGAAGVVAVGGSVAAGLIGGTLAQLTLVRLSRSDSSSTGYELVGLVGRLTATTGPTHGEVSLDDPREIETRIATSATWLEPGAAVRVIAVDGSKVVVEPVSPFPGS